MQTKQIDTNAFADLRSAIAHFRGCGKGPRRFPSQLKRAVLREYAAGVSLDTLAHELNLQPSLIYKWKRKGMPVAKRAPSPPPRVLAVEETSHSRTDDSTLRFEVSQFAVTISLRDRNP
jgi:transposase-like protein